MIKKIVKTYGKSILAPAITSVFLFILHSCSARKEYDYVASFVAEGVILFSIYLISVREIFTLRVKIEKNEKKHGELIETELKKAADLLSSVSADDKEGKEQAAKLYHSIIKEKSDFTQRQIKKHKDESDALTRKYNEALKDKEDVEAAVIKKIDQVKNESMKEKHKEQQDITSTTKSA